MTHESIPLGTDNVLVDLGFDDAEDLSARAAHALRFNTLIDRRDLSPVQVSALTGLTQTEVSQVRHYKLQHILRQRLMQALGAIESGAYL